MSLSVDHLEIRSKSVNCIIATENHRQVEPFWPEVIFRDSGKTREIGKASA